MELQQLLTLAQQGDEKAIANLLNQATQKKGITATVTRNGSCLHIVLVSTQVPVQADSIQLIQQGMRSLNPTPIKSVWVYGQQSWETTFAWSQALELSKPVPVPTDTPEADADSQPKSNQKKHKTKMPMLASGSISSLFLIAAGGFVANFQSIALASAASTPQTPVPVQLPASSPSQLAANPVANARTVRRPSGNLADSTSSLLSQNTETLLTIKAVGDTIPGSNFPKNELPSDPNMLFSAIKPYLQGADILFGNFESTLTTYPRSSKNPGRGRVFAFRTPPAYANILKQVGFDVLSVANNHSFDFFQAGFEDTFRNIKNAGMEPVGKRNQILYLNNDKNIPVAFIGFSHSPGHNSVNDMAAVKRLVQEASKKADIVVVSAHIGAEGTSALRVRNQQEIFYRERRGNPVLFARTAIDNGADLVLGHGPHVPRAMELYKGKLIAYSLGNFLGYQTLSTKDEKGYSLILEAKLNRQGDFVSGNIIPVHLNGEGIPYPDSQKRSVQLIRDLTKKDFPNTPLTIDSDGQISKN